MNEELINKLSNITMKTTPTTTINEPFSPFDGSRTPSNSIPLPDSNGLSWPG